MNAQHFSSASADGRRSRTDPGMTLACPSQELVVRRLKAADLPAVQAHLLSLEPADRHGRFHAFLGDEAIRDYVDGIDFRRMILAGAFDDDGRLVGLAEAHLDAAASPLRAETSVSVLTSHRGKGIGRLLTAVVLDAAAARGTRRADFYYQAGNRALARLVRELGAPIATAPGFASLSLPLKASTLH